MKYTSEKSYSVNTANLIIVCCLLCYSQLMNFRYRCNVYLRSNPDSDHTVLVLCTDTRFPECFGKQPCDCIVCMLE